MAKVERIPLIKPTRARGVVSMFRQHDSSGPRVAYSVFKYTMCQC